MCSPVTCSGDSRRLAEKGSYKQTNKQTNKQRNKTNKQIDLPALIIYMYLRICTAE
jgi:hypothetical protein